MCVPHKGVGFPYPHYADASLQRDVLINIKVLQCGKPTCFDNESPRVAIMDTDQQLWWTSFSRDDQDRVYAGNYIFSKSIWVSTSCIMLPILPFSPSNRFLRNVLLNACAPTLVVSSLPSLIIRSSIAVGAQAWLCCVGDITFPTQSDESSPKVPTARETCSQCFQII